MRPVSGTPKLVVVLLHVRVCFYILHRQTSLYNFLVYVSIAVDSIMLSVKIVVNIHVLKFVQ